MVIQEALESYFVLSRSQFCLTNYREPSCWLGKVSEYDKPRVINSLRPGQAWTACPEKAGTSLGSPWYMSCYCWVYCVSTLIDLAWLPPPVCCPGWRWVAGLKWSSSTNLWSSWTYRHTSLCWLLLSLYHRLEECFYKGGAHPEMPVVGKLCLPWWGLRWSFPNTAHLCSRSCCFLL